MKRILYLLFGMLLMSVGVFTSCEETEEVDTYANWEARNEHYLDSIVDLAEANSTGEWKIIRSYSQDYVSGGSSSSLLPSEGETNDYIYVKVIQDATALAEAEFGTGNAECRNVLFTDSVYVHYKGTLINGTIFDGTFTTTDLDYETTTPSKLAVSSMINGFTTALQSMLEGDHRLDKWMYKGDRWEVYIPYGLAYGTSGYGSSIPGYSVLIFDIALCRVWSPGEEIPEWN